MPLDRAKLLADTGVFVVFAAYKLRARGHGRKSGEAASLVREYSDRVAVDAYLARGLKASSDYFLRVHAYELAAIQSFLVAFGATALGRASRTTETFVGVTKPLQYITASRSPALSEALTATVYSALEPLYAIVIPVKKSADWWNLPAAARLKEIEAHTEPTLAFLPNVKRKLYHSTGLDDQDFITYFETSDLAAFNDLVIALVSIPENKYNVRLGAPTLLGTIHSVDEVFAAIAP